MIKLRFLFFGLFSVLAFAAFTFFAATELAANEEQALGRRLLAAHEQLRVRERLGLAEDRDLARAVALSPELVSAVLEAGPSARPGEPALFAARNALKSMTEKRAAPEVPSLVAVATAEGVALGKGAEAAVLDDPKALPLVEAALAGNEGAALAMAQGTLMRLAAAPVPGQGTAVLLGVPVTDSYARLLASALGADVTFVVSGNAVASSLPAGVREQAAALAAPPEAQRPFGPRIAPPHPLAPFLPIFPAGIGSAALHRGQARKLPDGAALVLSVPTDGMQAVGLVQLVGLGAAAFLFLVSVVWAFVTAAPLGRHARALAEFTGRLIADPKARIETKRTVRVLRPLAEGLNAVGEALLAARTASSKAGADPRAAAASESSFGDLDSIGPSSSAKREEAAPEPPPSEAATELPPEPASSEPPPSGPVSAPSEPEPPPSPPADAPTQAPEAPPPTPTLRGKFAPTVRAREEEPASDAASRAEAGAAARKAAPPPPDDLPSPGATQLFRAPLHLGTPDKAPVPLPPPKSAPTTALYESKPVEEPPAPADPEEQHYREVFKEFLATRERCGEPREGVAYESFAAKLRKARDAQVQKGARTVRFQVYVKEGKAALKATPIRDS